METFATDVSIGLAERINASSIATTAVDTVINALRSNMNPIRHKAEPLSLRDVDRETNVVAVAQQLFSDILARRLAALKKQHNTMLSINKLPAEILAHIISISIHSQPWSITTLSGLASVCSRWWRIIISTPSFWATAKQGENPELAIKMSKDLPLTVYVQDTLHFGELEGFIDIICPHTHRWQSVFIYSYFARHILPYFAYPLPQLEDLRLTSTEYLGGPENTLTLSATPKLRHLRLCGIGVNWKALPPLSLETLFLSNIQNHDLSMRHLYQLLASSPYLTNLTLVDLEDASDEDFLGEVISLERLRKVDIRDVGQRHLAGLAKVLQAPSLSSLTLEAVTPYGPNKLYLQDLLQPSSKGGLLPSVIRNQALNPVYVQASGRGFALSDTSILANRSGTYLDLNIQRMASKTALLILGAPDRGYDVDVDVSECGLRGQELCRVLGLVDPLVLRLRSDDILSVMEELSKVPMPSEKWFCPRLSDLYLVSGTFDPNRTARALQVRNGLEETGDLPGRSRLSVYDARGRLFNPTTMSF